MTGVPAPGRPVHAGVRAGARALAGLLSRLARGARAVAGLPGRLATAADRISPVRALAGLLAVVLLVGAALVVIATRSPGTPQSQWLARSAVDRPGSATPSPATPAPATPSSATPSPANPSPANPSPANPSPAIPAGERREPPRPAGAAPQLSPLPPPPQPPTGDFVAWAILDTGTGRITGSDNLAATSTTASMIKAWVVADYLRLAAEAGEAPSTERLDQLTLIIRDSHNGHTDTVFQEIGAHASIARLISICGLTDSRATPHRWSTTRLSPRDTARMGTCLADGRGAGPEWTDWLLGEMRAVRGLGDFGIRHAFPPDQRSAIAIKNGWVIRSSVDAWHVNCLAIGDGWTMGVMSRYPERLGYQHGAETCRALAADHLT